MSVGWQVARRFVFAVFAVYLVVSVAFGFIALTPDPNESWVASGASGPDPTGSRTEAEQEEANQAALDAIAAYREARNLDEPVLDRYADWLVDITTFDWGVSHEPRAPSRYGARYAGGIPVTTLLGRGLSHTLRYVVPAMAFAVVAGLGLGLYAATHRNALSDRALTGLAHLGYGLPNFWLAEMLLLVLLSEGGWLAGLPRATQGVLTGTVLPAAVLATTLVAGQLRYARAESLEYVDTEFLKLVRAKGAADWDVAGHLLRNAALPLLSLFFTEMIGVLVLNIYVIEYVFGVPGLGGLSLFAIAQRDMPVVLGTVFVVAVVGIGGNFLQDVAYLVLDPRVE